MTGPSYDVIVVGARVAGAATAMLLARRGLRVLVVDQARFPATRCRRTRSRCLGSPDCGVGGCSMRSRPPVLRRPRESGSIAARCRWRAGFCRTRESTRFTARAAPFSTRSWSMRPAPPARRSARASGSRNSRGPTVASSASTAGSAAGRRLLRQRHGSSSEPTGSGPSSRRRSGRARTVRGRRRRSAATRTGRASR